MSCSSAASITLHWMSPNPADLERPVGFNVLDGVTPDTAALVTDNVIAAFIHIWGESAIGPRSQQVLRNSLRALMDTPGSTLLGIPRLLTDARYRTKIVARVTDPVVRSYCRDQFETYEPRLASEVTAPIQNKLDAMLSVPAFRNIVGQSRSTISLRVMMDEGRILIANLSKGALGEVTSHLLGALITTSIASATMSRVDTRPKDRHTFHFFADEFQNYANSGYALILSEGI